jgi:nicotinamide mononucleotide (NMN) deamidase PncC
VSESRDLIEQIHASGKQFVLALTGGGSGAISQLLEVPGASASVLEAIVPYASSSLADWLGGKPDQFCSERTARAMAMAAFERARMLSNADPFALRGIGATASLASNRPKRGPHRIHIAWQSAETTVVSSFQFPSEGTRAEEEPRAAQLILEAVAEASGWLGSSASEPPGALATGGSPSARPQPPGNPHERREQHAPAEWSELLLGRRTFVSSTDRTSLMFPGSFNPIHAAHQRMAEVAGKRNGCPVTFELSITNVDKPPLDFIEIADRLAQFRDQPVLLSRAPTFVEKARIAPGCVFVVGIDTLMRIGEPAYYTGNSEKRDAAIRAIKEAGCRFLVFGRVIAGGFQTLSNSNVPQAMRELCDEVPESEFREDICSTELRGK